MDELELLKKSIIKCPLDKVAKLAYADFCEENNLIPERYIKFIRSQINEPNGMNHVPLGYLGDELQSYIRKHFFQEEPFISVSEPGKTYFRNKQGDLNTALYFEDGFISRVYCLEYLWISSGPRLVELFPISRVKLHLKAPGPEGSGFRWFRRYGNSPSYIDFYQGNYISWTLWPFLKPYNKDAFKYSKFYTTLEAGFEALSEACVRYARFTSKLDTE